MLRGWREVLATVQEVLDEHDCLDEGKEEKKLSDQNLDIW